MEKGFRLNKTWYYIFSCTWGIITTTIGLIVSCIMLLTGHRPRKNIYGWYFTTKQNLGGFSMGPCAIVCENPSNHLLEHEFGHSIQNCFLGPLFIFYVMIPSVIRFWYRELNNVTEPSYDYAWFEQQATMFGERYKGF